MDLKYWAATDVGRKRTHNEDNYLIDQNLRLFVVADGMGGHATGEVASAMAVHTIRGIVHRESDLFEEPRDDPAWHMEVCMLLEYAVHAACEGIYRKGVQEPEKKGMGTTVVALLISGDRGYIAYVGDSRIYLLRGGIVYQLTEDHSLMNELIRQGKITAEAFDDSPYAQFKHAMTRAVGPNETVEVDTLDFDMIPGDSFLLCSDGLYEYLDDTDISRMLSLTEVKDIPGRLIDMANTRGGKDNITALVIQVPENADGSDRAAEINFTLDTLKNIPLFAQLTYQQLVRIMNLTRVVPFDEGDVLCYEGQPAEELYVILRGEVELTAGETVIASLGSGSHFGEMALIDTTPRSATATATADGKVLMINREDFYEILRKEAPLAVKLLWAFIQELTARLRQTNADLSAARANEIVDLSEEIVISESSGEMSREAVEAAIEAEELEEIEELEELEEIEDVAESSEAGSPAKAELEVELDALPQRSDHTQAPTVPEPTAFPVREAEAPVGPTRVKVPGLINNAADAFGSVGAPEPVHDSDDDIHVRATRPIGIPTDDDDDEPFDPEG